MRYHAYYWIVLLLTVFLPGSVGLAGEADVLAASVQRTGDGIYRFDVTVEHADSGWDHYANKWEIIAPDGSVLGTRELLHPHVDEQPFTRSLSGVSIAPAIRRVTVRAYDSVHANGGKELNVDLSSAD
jgi:hypothetical protein